MSPKQLIAVYFMYHNYILIDVWFGVLATQNITCMSLKHKTIHITLLVYVDSDSCQN